MLTVERVSYREGARSILQDVSFSLLPGKIVSLIGPNGAGKTTLVELLVGSLSPSSGKIRRLPHLRMGYMPQNVPFDPILPVTVGWFLSVGLRLSERKAIPQVLEEVGLGDVGQVPLRGLSGGEWQRVLLARALLRKPHLLLLDEPSSGVDLRGQALFYERIAAIRKQYGCGLLLVSHDLHMVMNETDEVICLNRHICCSGVPERVSRDPEFAALFGLSAQRVAWYAHHHDHHHNIEGQVVLDEGAPHE